MSENYLRLIPNDPRYVPALAAQKQAEYLLRSYLNDADEVSAMATEHIEFIDPGANLESISCPSCGGMLAFHHWHEEMNLAYHHWHEAMNLAYHDRFSNLAMEMPCCGAKESLNDLRYHWSAGFARFVLQARNPGGDLDGTQIEDLQQVLGCALRKIRAHY